MLEMLPRVSPSLVALLLCGPVAVRVPAQAHTGTLIIAHGGGPDWNAGVKAMAAQVRTGGPVEVAFLMGPEAKDTRFQDMVARLSARGARQVVIVPLLISSYSGHYEQIQWLARRRDSLSATMSHHLHMSGIDRAAPDVAMRVTRALDDAPELARVLAERARGLAAPAEPRDRALFIVGHGPETAEDHARWMENCRRIAEQVKTLTGFRDIRVGLVRDDAPPAVRAEAVRGVRDLIELQAASTGGKVVVVPMLISKGSVSRDKLPQDLDGLPVTYSADGVVPHAEIARWVERQVRESVAALRSGADSILKNDPPR